MKKENIILKSEVARLILHQLFDKPDYAMNISRKIKKTNVHVSNVIKTLEKDKLINEIFSRQRKKRFKLTIKGEKAVELLLKIKSIS